MTQSCRLPHLAFLFAVPFVAACGNRSENIVTPVQKITAETPVAFAGVGPIAIGMTRADAEGALDEPLLPQNQGGATDGCFYVHLSGGPMGLSFMLIDQMVARIDIDKGSPLRTSAGAGIGSSEEEIATLYEPRLSIAPHKYDTGHYLTAASTDPKQSALRYIFETDGTRVTRYRVGRIPEVEFVERCG